MKYRLCGHEISPVGNYTTQGKRSAQKRNLQGETEKRKKTEKKKISAINKF